MDDRLARLLEELRVLGAERRKLLADFRAQSALTSQIQQELSRIAGESLSRLQAARQRARTAGPTPPSPRRAASALQAALDAYDRAFRSPSSHGLPSHAAVAAYLAVLPDPEPLIRAKLEAALSLRTAPGSRPN